MYDACGHYLIVELDEVEKESKSASGIITSVNTGDKGKREQAGMSLATVINIGPNCWIGHGPNGNDHIDSPWCKETDRIMIADYAGQKFPIPEDLGENEKARLSRYRLIKDDDVLARLV